MPVRSPTVAAARIDYAVEQLAAMRSTHRAVAMVAETWGVSARQARRIVRQAHERLAADLEETGVDRRQLAAQLAHGLVESFGLALSTNQPGAAVASARELRKLLGLAAAEPLHQPPRPRPSFPSFR